jgi:hypothetical protein
MNPVVRSFLSSHFLYADTYRPVNLTFNFLVKIAIASNRPILQGNENARSP